MWMSCKLRLLLRRLLRLRVLQSRRRDVLLIAHAISIFSNSRSVTRGVFFVMSALRRDAAGSRFPVSENGADIAG